MYQDTGLVYSSLLVIQRVWPDDCFCFGSSATKDSGNLSKDINQEGKKIPLPSFSIIQNYIARWYDFPDSPKSWGVLENTEWCRSLAAFSPSSEVPLFVF